MSFVISATTGSSVAISKEQKILPLITIAMPVSNSGWSLPKVLANILELDYDIRRLRLVFVDNCSTDNTLAVISEFAEKHGTKFESIVTEKAKSNIPVARNICFEKCGGSDYIFILDSDVIVPPDTLKVLLEDFQSFKNVGMTSFPWDHENAKSRARSLYNAFAKSAPKTYAYKVGNGCNLLSMKAYKAVGDFNPRLYVHEDGEYCFRLRKKGYNIVCDFSHEGIHLKRVPTPAKFYLKFIKNSSNTYIEMLRAKSGMHALKFLTSILLVAFFCLAVISRQWIYLYGFIATMIAAFWVNTSKRILDDGIHVRVRYLPLVAPVFTSLTIVVVFASLSRVVSRTLKSVFSLVKKN